MPKETEKIHDNLNRRVTASAGMLAGLVNVPSVDCKMLRRTAPGRLVIIASLLLLQLVKGPTCYTVSAGHAGGQHKTMQKS